MSVTNVTTTNSGGTIISGDTWIVSAGGFAEYGYVSSGGTVIVSSGGFAQFDDISSGGVVIASSGGIAYSDNVLSGGTVIIASGGSANTDTVLSGGTVIVLSSGYAYSDNVSSGGTLILSSGGYGEFDKVSSGGTSIAASGGTSAEDSVSSGGTVIAAYGGKAENGFISSGGVMIVSSGGTIYDAAVSSGGTVIVSSGGTGQYEAVSSGATMIAFSGGTAYYDYAYSGGTLIASSGGTAYADYVRSGGTLIASSGGYAYSAHVSGAGTMIVSSGGTADAAMITGSGTVDLLSGGVVSGGISFFTSSGGFLVVTGTGGGLVGSGGQATQTIGGFAQGDTIDLTALASGSVTSLSFNSGTDILTIDNSAGASLTLKFDGLATGASFSYSADGTGGTDVVVCYYPGTGIRTPAGDVPVERLCIGDSVMLADGRVLPVRWIGRNTVSTRFADPLRVLPIRIRAGALGENRPERDLLVSPQHAVLVEDILIQAGALVNGLSVLREAQVPETFVYYHVEVSEHALILAEGLPAESFVDNVHRSVFDNWAEHEALYGQAPITELPYPRAQSHRQVPRKIAAALMARAMTLSGAKGDVA